MEKPKKTNVLFISEYRRLLNGISVGMAFARGLASQQSTTEVLLQRRWEGSQRPGRLSSTIAVKQLQNKGSAEGFGTKWYQLYCFIVLFCSFPFSKRTHPKASAWDSIPWTASALATSASQKISFQPELQQLDPFWTKESTNPRIHQSIPAWVWFSIAMISCWSRILLAWNIRRNVGLQKLKTLTCHMFKKLLPTTAAYLHGFIRSF